MIPFRTLCSKLRAAIKALPAAQREALGELPRALTGGSSYSYRIDPAAFLSICSALRIDPLTGETFAPGLHVFARTGKLALWHVGVGCAVHRDLKGLSVRAAAEVAGISASTITRLETGQPISIESVLAVCEFIGVHPFGYMQNENRRAA